MNTTKQFWTLLKFQCASNPFIWLLALAFGLPLFFFLILPPSYHPPLATLLTPQNFFFVGIIAVWAIVPEMAQGRRNAMWSPGTEFLVTRAIDRPILYRARAGVLYLVVLLVPLASLLHSFSDPTLKVNEYSETARQECLSHVPGATLQPDPQRGRDPLISIRAGNVLLAGWLIWLFIVAAFILQILLLLLYPQKHRAAIFYTLFGAYVILPLVPLFINLKQMGAHLNQQAPPAMERLFFSFAEHPLPFWLITVLALILGELWCERRFAKLEQ